MKLTGRISRRLGNRNPASAMEDADACDRPQVRRSSPSCAPRSDVQHRDEWRFNTPTRRITNL